ncbi:MAG: hypothetical protein NPIRA03_25620 [Nitrospirales bacterium]|nr:MAG: hypothetical protein NPIRA03_25620 [Nitrospirales bacterium]
MSEEQKLTFKQGPSKDDLILQTREGEIIAQIYPRDGYPGSHTLLVRDHGGNWGDKPGRYFDQLLAAQHEALNHGKEYFRQEQEHLSEANRFHTINDLGRQFEKMGGDPQVMKDFKAEWDRVSAAHYHIKVAGREKDSQDRDR